MSRIDGEVMMAHGLTGRALDRFSAPEPMEQGRAVEAFWSFDLEQGRPVVLKVLPERRTAEASLAADWPEDVRALVRMRHAAIETVFGVERSGDRLLLVTECVPGSTLARRPPPVRPDGAEAQRDGLALARAIRHAHECGVVHGAISPSTVMRLPDGGVKLVDFGVARHVLGVAAFLAGGEEPVSAALRAAIPYLAPEQLLGDEPGPRSDLYSFGVLLHLLATGSHPFASRLTTVLIAEIVRGRPPALAPRRSHPASPLDPIIDGCLAPNPLHRFDSAADVVRALEHAR